MPKPTCTNIPTAFRVDDFVIYTQAYTAVAIAVRPHLFPYRTEKLSSLAPMVLPHQVGE